MVGWWLDGWTSQWLLQIPRVFWMFFVFKAVFFGGADFAEVGFLVKSDFLSSFICLGALWGGKKSAKRLQDAKNVG